MSNQIPLSGATEPELADAIQGNLFALFHAMVAALPESELVQTEQYCYHHAFPSNPMFKGVWKTRLTNDNVEATVKQTMAWFKERNAPFVFWWVGSDTSPPDLPEYLQAFGFKPSILGDPGMAANLHALNENIPMPDGFRIVLAPDQQALEDWRDVFCTSYGIPLWAGQAWVDATMRVGVDQAPWKLYVGYLNDKPVATNILFNGAGVSGVYGVGTIPETRGKGIGAAITLHPLLDARKQGYQYGVLFSTEMGYRVYERLGFRDVNCKIGRYLWIDPAA